MRQAGRYMKEYRDVRERHRFLDLCKDKNLATEVTVYAVQRLGVDATPTVFINGRRISGAQPYEVFARAIDDELARPNQ